MLSSRFRVVELAQQRRRNDVVDLYARLRLELSEFLYLALHLSIVLLRGVLPKPREYISQGFPGKGQHLVTESSQVLRRQCLFCQLFFYRHQVLYLLKLVDLLNVLLY